MSFMDAFQKDQAKPKVKPVVAIGVGMSKPKPDMGGGDDDDMPEPSDDGGLNPAEEAAARAAMASLKGGDMKGFGLALKQFVRSCGDYDDDDDEDDKSDEGSQPMPSK